MKKQPSLTHVTTRVYDLSVCKAPQRPCGFTLIELIAVTAMLALLALTLAPALVRTQPNSRGIQCLNNNRQLCAAWRMYAEDNHDAIPYASDDGTGTLNPLNQYAWTQTHLDFNPSNRQNWDPTYLKQSPLWPYCGQNQAIWKCPSDTSSVVVNGVRRPRIRTMAMNIYLGGFAGTDGGWAFARSTRFFFKIAEMVPTPAKIFVFLDMRTDLINWGSFLTDMSGYSPANPALYAFQSDYPGFAHNNACGFSFADNHVEMKRWQDPRTVPITLPEFGTCPGNPDVAWLQDHATRPK